MAFTGIGIDVLAAMAPALPDYEHLVTGVPRGAWVAISKDETRLVAYSADLAEALQIAHDLGERDPIVFRIPECNSALIL